LTRENLVVAKAVVEVLSNEIKQMPFLKTLLLSKIEAVPENY